jgi:hypothetical protein
MTEPTVHIVDTISFLRHWRLLRASAAIVDRGSANEFRPGAIPRPQVAWWSISDAGGRWTDLQAALARSGNLAAVSTATQTRCRRCRRCVAARRLLKRRPSGAADACSARWLAMRRTPETFRQKELRRRSTRYPRASGRCWASSQAAQQEPAASRSARQVHQGDHDETGRPFGRRADPAGAGDACRAGLTPSLGADEAACHAHCFIGPR